MSRLRLSVAVLFALLCAGSSPALGHGESDIVLAPGYQALSYPAPEPGSYQLPPIRRAGDGLLLDEHGESVSLHRLLDGRVSVVSFIYRACDDVNGCPLATYVMNQLRQRLASVLGTRPGSAETVQLLSISFDPVHDTPASLAEYRQSFGHGGVSWSFLTAESFEQIDPVLQAWGQDLERGDNPDDEPVLAHTLRVYLVDPALQIRNIYSSSLLHADTVVSDIMTVLQQQSPPAPVTANPQRDLTRPADNRDGYADGSYRSRTQQLQRRGQALDLVAHATRTRAGLPALVSPPVSEPLVRLGQRLFFDRRLSHNETISCAMCHVPSQGFAFNELATPVGFEGRSVRRNAPTLLNVAYLDKLFHDGREFDLAQQAWSPLLAPNEMANPSIGHLLNKLTAIAEYRQDWQAVFGSARPTMHQLGDALAAYQRTLIAADTPFDRWRAGQNGALSAEAVAGFELFRGKAGCVSCHLVSDTTALFTDQQLHNTGIGYRQSQPQAARAHPVTLAPGVVLEIDPSVYQDAAEPRPIDLGLYEITRNPDDRWKFRTPTLRNVALSAPYMHDGSLGTLRQVVEFYNDGGIGNPLLSPLIRPLNLADHEIDQLVIFLESLTSPEVDALVLDAMNTRIGDVRGL